MFYFYYLKILLKIYLEIDIYIFLKGTQMHLEPQDHQDLLERNNRSYKNYFDLT